MSKDIPVYGIYLRKCDECGKGMNQGYLADYHYYCSDECLHKHITAEEWTDLFNDGESDEYYWTEWDCVDNEDELYDRWGNRYVLNNEEEA